MQQPGIVIARDSGLIVVPGAVPVSHGWVAGLDGLAALLGSHGAPARRPETRADGTEPPAR